MGYTMETSRTRDTYRSRFRGRSRGKTAEIIKVHRATHRWIVYAGVACVGRLVFPAARRCPSELLLPLTKCRP